MARVDIAGVAFVALALLTLGSAAIVAFARSVMHSAAGLLGVLCGVAGFYALLSDDFLAAVQLLVYVGGTLVVFLFAVKHTGKGHEDCGRTCRTLPCAVANAAAVLAEIC